MKRFRVFIFNSLLMVIGSLILQVIRLCFNIYISNRISTEALGVFQLIMATYMFGITLAASGINIASTRIISEEMAFGNDYGVRKSSRKTIKIAIILSVIASLIFYLNSDFIVHFCFEDKVSCNIVYLICLALPLISISSAITGYFTAVRRAYKTVIGQFLEQISKIIAIAILLNIYLPLGALEGICFALILGDLISELVSFLYLIFAYIFDISYHFSTLNTNSTNSFLYRIFRILIPVAFTSYIRSGISTVKQLIIPSSLRKNGFNSEFALSTYGIISGMAMPIVMFPASLLASVSGLLIPEFSRYYVKQDYIKIRKYTDKLIICSFLFACSITVFFWIFGDNISITVYNNTDVGMYIKLFAALIPFMYVDIIIDNILKGLDAQTDVMGINIIDLIVSTSFIFFFVPLLGLKGYIISVFISEILNLGLSLNRLLKIENGFDSY
ncbi:MAG: oligosaccharide flippase family protein [Clostridia bacterium]|nr:oligosaccharide flippase family protein [Clostridia bacterium]